MNHVHVACSLMCCGWPGLWLIQDHVRRWHTNNVMRIERCQLGKWQEFNSTSDRICYPMSSYVHVHAFAKPLHVHNCHVAKESRVVLHNDSALGHWHYWTECTTTPVWRKWPALCAAAVTGDWFCQNLHITSNGESWMDTICVYTWWHNYRTETRGKYLCGESIIVDSNSKIDDDNEAVKGYFIL